jgi:centriolar protein POC1
MLKDATIPTLPLSMKNANRRVLVDPTIDRSLQGHRSPISSVAFHPSPSLLATRKNSNIEQIASSSIDGELTLWNFSSEKEVRAYRYVGHTGPIHHVTYSPSGSLLASCSSDKTTRLWVPKVNGESIVLKGHTAPVRCVDFSPTSHVGCKNDMEDVSFLATCSDDKTVKVWNLPDKSFRCSFTGEIVMHNDYMLYPSTFLFLNNQYRSYQLGPFL